MIQLDSPFLLGFEQTRLLIERVAKAAGESYPPYNVEESGEDKVRITLAVAGFAIDDLEVRVEDHQLIVTGKRETQAGEGERAYLHRGIAARGFSRAFVLADGLEVEAACLEHGLLHIDVARPKPEIRSRRIPIQTGRSS
ncbi:MAG: Hsp20 family protein [Alphaproteobacteria bacterium]